MRVARDGDQITVVGEWYRLTTRPGSGVAVLDDLAGGRWAELRLLASVDTLDGPDETLDVAGPTVEESDDAPARLTWDLRSSRWAARRVVLEARPATVEIRVEVEGSGRVTDVSILAGRALLPRTSGVLMSGAWFQSILSPSPTDPGRIVRPASESAVVGVVSGSEPGRGNWFFTPGPFCFAATREPIADPVSLPDGPWLTLGLAVAPGEADFTGFAYRAVDRGFGFALEYDGKTAVDGPWRSPAIVIGRADDAYEGIAAHGRLLASRGLVPPSRDRSVGSRPAWWREPIFCGWGAQSALARAAGEGFAAAARHATQAAYDGFLEALESRGVVPGTVTIDDKWQAAYATCEPDTRKWPDLRAWIAARHERGQRVLLWYKAWDAEGAPEVACLRSVAGVPLRLDPARAAGESTIRAAVRSMLDPAGLDADGLKIDFTASTPSGAGVERTDRPWGVELLRLLLDTVADEARRVKPDALLVGHTPNPLVAPAVDMIRLNDSLRLDDPRPLVDVVPQMRYRAALVRAACPEHLVDTDDWCAPDLARWRAYASLKPSLGVPALYYATQLDLSLEMLEDSDYELLRRSWADYRRRDGLPARD